ncbi:unnamed protein product, partial [Cylicostephanus goldi]
MILRVAHYRIIASQNRLEVVSAMLIWDLEKKPGNSPAMPIVRKALKHCSNFQITILGQTADNKKQLNEEIKEKFGDFKENCFPKPTGGCRCNEKDAQGNEVVTAYNDAAQCKIRSKRDVGATVQRQPATINQPAQKYRSRDQPSQNVRDPVRERAQANYAAVLDELHNKFKGLKEGCFPRPKGCLCVIGKTAEGRDITERRMKDADCKCK